MRFFPSRGKISTLRERPTAISPSRTALKHLRDIRVGVRIAIVRTRQEAKKERKAGQTGRVVRLHCREIRKARKAHRRGAARVSCRSRIRNSRRSVAVRIDDYDDIKLIWLLCIIRDTELAKDVEKARTARWRGDRVRGVRETERRTAV